MMEARYVRCKNYDKHSIRYVEKMTIEDFDPARWLLIPDYMAIHYGWQKTDEGWLCPECIKAEEGYGKENNSSS